MGLLLKWGNIPQFKNNARNYAVFFIMQLFSEDFRWSEIRIQASLSVYVPLGRLLVKKCFSCSFTLVLYCACQLWNIYIAKLSLVCLRQRRAIFRAPKLYGMAKWDVCTMALVLQVSHILILIFRKKTRNKPFTLGYNHRKQVKIFLEDINKTCETKIARNRRHRDTN